MSATPSNFQSTEIELCKDAMALSLRLLPCISGIIAIIKFCTSVRKCHRWLIYSIITIVIIIIFAMDVMLYSFIVTNIQIQNQSLIMRLWIMILLLLLIGYNAQFMYFMYRVMIYTPYNKSAQIIDMKFIIWLISVQVKCSCLFAMFQ